MMTQTPRTNNILGCVQLRATLAASDLSQEEKKPICFIATTMKVSENEETYNKTSLG